MLPLAVLEGVAVVQRPTLGRVLDSRKLLLRRGEVARLKSLTEELQVGLPLLNKRLKLLKDRTCGDGRC